VRKTGGEIEEKLEDVLFLDLSPIFSHLLSTRREA